VTQAAEQETIFRYAAGEDVVRISTCHRPTALKLERFGYRPVEVRTQDGASVWVYTVPIREFRWGIDQRPTRSPRTS